MTNMSRYSLSVCIVSIYFLHLSFRWWSHLSISLLIFIHRLFINRWLNLFAYVLRPSSHRFRNLLFCKILFHCSKFRRTKSCYRWLTLVIFPLQLLWRKSWERFFTWQFKCAHKNARSFFLFDAESSDVLIPEQKHRNNKLSGKYTKKKTNRRKNGEQCKTHKTVRYICIYEKKNSTGCYFYPRLCMHVIFFFNAAVRITVEGHEEQKVWYITL